MTQEATTPETSATPTGGRALAVFKIAVPILLLIGAGVWFYSRNRVNTDDAQVDGHLVPVSSRVYGSVEKVLVTDNQPVKAGDLLVEVDPKDIQAKLDETKAALLASQAQVQMAQAESERAQEAYRAAQGSDLAVARANVDAQKAAAEKARMDLQRMKPLAAREEISAQQFDAYRTQADVAENQFKAAQARLASLDHEAQGRRLAVGAAAAHLEAAKAQVAQAQAAVEALRLQKGYTRIVAPVDGVVTRKFVELGQTIQPGQSLMTLIPLHQTWITANFKETQLARMKPGQDAEIEVDMNGEVLKGHVDSIAGSTGSRMSLLPPENAVGNFVKVVQRIPVKIRVDESDRSKVILRPGMNVEVTVFVK
jgi:membrane fusion protein (multidrug efflux system)